MLSSSFFFNYTPTTEIYTLSLHDALPIWLTVNPVNDPPTLNPISDVIINENAGMQYVVLSGIDRKSTRLNSSHTVISYAVFCLKKKKTEKTKINKADNNRYRKELGPQNIQ